ncbi:PilZ domain-containing protein [Photobacterium sp.]|uniref:PilZ domain-containing protein n=1 Tax=Photobacterium sp. TaxID=660 RepID=UPI00299D1909|nr:PilZ domain-containing protein [Photobacterium sp.]MDX1303608.1 PilZ domain-containing protein [Photobacterium sp.]
MIERRKHSRIQADYEVILNHPSFGTVVGKVRDMSDSGVFLTFDSITAVDDGLVVEAKIQGDGWDESMPFLKMRVMRQEALGMALQFVVEPFARYAISRQKNAVSR